MYLLKSASLPNKSIFIFLFFTFPTAEMEISADVQNPMSHPSKEFSEFWQTEALRDCEPRPPHTPKHTYSSH